MAPKRKRTDIRTSMVFFTLTHIKKHFGDPEAIKLLFPTAAWVAIGWEHTCAPVVDALAASDTPLALTQLLLSFTGEPANAHVYVLVDLGTATRWRRSTFDPLMQFHGTHALNYQSFESKKTYKLDWCAKNFRGRAHRPLWMWEKFTYCQIGASPDYRQFFDTSKYGDKMATWISGSTTCPQEVIDKMQANALAYANQKKEGTRTLSLPDAWCAGITSGKITSKNYRQIMYTEGDEYPLRFRRWGMQNRAKVEKQVTDYEEFCYLMAQEAQYPKVRATYRPFQEELALFLDTPSDRTIRLHVDTGNTGKSMFTRNEGTREDTLFLSIAKGKDIAKVYDEKKHRRVIILVPRNGMKYIRSQGPVIEAIKDGLIFSGKYLPRAKIASSPTAVVILGNEDMEYSTWTEGRMEKSWTSAETGYESHVMPFGEPLPPTALPPLLFDPLFSE